MRTDISVSTIYFHTPIDKRELPCFRGAVIELMEKEKAPVYFHNHTENGYRYAYPMVQYKVIDGKAVMVCIGKGVELVGQFFAALKPEIKLGHRKADLSVENVVVDNTGIEVMDQLTGYTISCWLPLNQENISIYNQTDSLVQRVMMLESLLIGNILSMAKGLELYIEEEVKVMIMSIDKDYTINYKGVRMKAIDLSFKSNVLLPDNVGLGKGVSLGMGMIRKI